MKNQMLLLEDVDKLGRKGDIVNVKPGYARNYLLPQKLCVIASPSTLRMRARLQEERAKQALIDREDSESLARRVEGMTLTAEVKLDPEGNLYGSVGVTDILALFKEQGIEMEKRCIVLPHPIKKVGLYELSLKLKEGVPAHFKLEVLGDRPIATPEEKTE
jgi:large subunit ribosomal protein L9